MVFGLGDLFTGDEEPHVGMHQVLRSSPVGGVELGQDELRGGQALLGSFFTDGQRPCSLVDGSTKRPQLQSPRQRGKRRYSGNRLRRE